MALNKHLQFYRGATQYASLDAAKAAFDDVTLMAGEPAVAFYTEGSAKKAVLAIGDGTGKTFFYNGDNIDKLIEDAINELKGNASASADTLGELEALINAEKTARETAIAAMDLTEVGGTGKVITTISEADGVVSATAIDLKGENVAYTAAGTENYVSASTTIHAAINALDTAVKDAADAQNSYKLRELTSEEVTALGANVKEAYKLQVKAATGSTFEDVAESPAVKIYKDSSLKSVELDGQELVFTYIKADGTEEEVRVDVSKFLAETEFKDGFQLGTGAASGTVSVKLDATAGSDSAKFLYMKEITGENGAIALSGITEAIAAAKSEVLGASTDTSANTTVYGAFAYAKDYADSVVADKNVEAEGETGTTALVEASAEDNKVTVTSTQKLKNAVAAAEAAIQSVGEGSSIENFVSLDVATTGKAVTVTINDAALKTKIDAIDASLTALSGTTGDTSGVTSVNGAKAYAKDYTDKAVADLAVQATGDTYVSAMVGTGADNKKVTVAATQKTQDAIAAAEDSLQNVTGANAIEVGTKSGDANAKTQAISLKINATNSWLSQDADGLKVINTLDCGTF